MSRRLLAVSPGVLAFGILGVGGCVAPATPGGQATGDLCASTGAKLVACGYEPLGSGWLDLCRGDASYQDCLRSAGDDCNAMSVCGYRQFAGRSCNGRGVPAGTADCAATTACQAKCGSDNACVCECNGKLAPDHARATGIQNVCSLTHCQACGTAGHPACDACFSQHCGALYSRYCTAAASQPASTPPSGQCTRDSDCKGDRICEQGSCRDPR
jgi:hypothetical protein